VREAVNVVIVMKLVTGVASDRSIATGIARALKREGADVVLTYQGEGLKARVQGIAASLGTVTGLHTTSQQSHLPRWRKR
jgi:enoyl-[acyl-carrier-protein] reductase (NADH)